MNKSDLIARMSKDADISKTAAEKALDSFMETVREALVRNENVRLSGFGTFRTGRRSSRSGRNPKTGEIIAILAKRVARFQPGSALRQAL